MDEYEDESDERFKKILWGISWDAKGGAWDVYMTGRLLCFCLVSHGFCVLKILTTYTH